MIPLHWNHSSEPEDIVGHVNPATVEAVDGEVVASGWVDQSTDRGAHVWRLAKAQTLGFSFGYLIPTAARSSAPTVSKRSASSTCSKSPRPQHR